MFICVLSSCDSFKMVQYLWNKTASCFMPCIVIVFICRCIAGNKLGTIISRKLKADGGELQFVMKPQPIVIFGGHFPRLKCLLTK